MKRLRLGVLGIMVGILTACTGVSVEDYAENSPNLVLEEFFSGRLSAHGIVKNRSGKVIRYFNADINASWENGTGTLEEDFVFNDGEVQQRVWTLRPQGDSRYIGTAGDVIGSSEIVVAGNSVFLNYVLRIPWGEGSLDLSIDDRMYLVSERVLINESRMSKWGFGVGSIILVIEKRD